VPSEKGYSYGGAKAAQEGRRSHGRGFGYSFALRWRRRSAISVWPPLLNDGERPGPATVPQLFVASHFLLKTRPLPGDVADTT